MGWHEDIELQLEFMPTPEEERELRQWIEGRKHVEWLRNYQPEDD